MPRRLTLAIFNEPMRWSLDPAHTDRIAEHAPEGVEVVAVTTRDALREALPETDYLVGFPLPGGEDPGLFKRLRWVQLVGSGGESMAPVGELARRGVRITSASSIRAASTAEHAIALLLAITRGLVHCLTAQQEHRWATDEIAPTIADLAGATVGVVDLDPLGAEIAGRLTAFGVELLATARRDADHDLRCEFDSILDSNRADELLSRSDIIIVANPAPVSRPALTRSDLAQCNPGSVLIDVSLSGVIRHDDLVWALERRHLGSAGLDVFEQEPLPPQSPLWSMPNVIITPHCAPVSPRYWDRACEVIAANLERVAADSPEALPLIDEITGRWSGPAVAVR
ncbi:MAG: hypothetical protein H6813_03975 [Phycisphaeraceae bacterium]|nr:hypothetical protein [Phycisphaeraceae bacterium]MCB9847104.1 hypothetical protein [Phycisphaeraceae bacterium]